MTTVTQEDLNIYGRFANALITDKGSFGKAVAKFNKEKTNEFNSVQKIVTLIGLLIFIIIFFYSAVAEYSLRQLNKISISEGNPDTGKIEFLSILFWFIFIIFFVHVISLMVFIYDVNEIAWKIYKYSSTIFLVSSIMFYIFAINYYETSPIKDKIKNIESILNYTLFEILNSMIIMLTMSIVMFIVTIFYFLFISDSFSIFSLFPSGSGKNNLAEKLAALPPACSSTSNITSLERDKPVQQPTTVLSPQPYNSAPGCYGGATPKVIVFN
jgi:hypothetical protein